MKPKLPEDFANREQRVRDDAAAMCDLLVDCDGATRSEVRCKLGWPESRFETALQYARAVHLPAIGGLTIPHPVARDGFTYRVTGSWAGPGGVAAIKEGTALQMRKMKATAAALLRDAQACLDHEPRGTLAWRECNALRKHMEPLMRSWLEIEADARAREI
jgi:hypothetical protein